jgi:iron complex transport system ATP-binding protein
MKAITNKINNAPAGLDIIGLNAAYAGQSFILKDISFNAGCGSILGVLGPNGSGKSTLIMALAGHVPLSDGRILWQGRNITGLKPRQRAGVMAVLPQKTLELPDMSVLDIVLMGRYAQSSRLFGYNKTDEAMAAVALKQTNCEHLARKKIQAVSGGELQRVLLARALAQNCPILLLDEPGSSLDPGQSPAMLALLRQLAAEHQLCVVLAMHDLNLAALYCDCLVLLKGGQVFTSGVTSQVFTKPVLEYIYDATFTMVDHPAGFKQALYTRI